MKSPWRKQTNILCENNVNSWNVKIQGENSRISIRLESWSTPGLDRWNKNSLFLDFFLQTLIAGESSALLENPDQEFDNLENICEYFFFEYVYLGPCSLVTT